MQKKKKFKDLKISFIFFFLLKNGPYTCFHETCMILFQNELSAATHLTSKLLKDYEKQVIPDHFLHYISSL